MRTLLSALVLSTLAGASATAAAPGLDAVIAGDHRTPVFAERDRYRNPQATLEFFGLRPDMTVVEVWPGTGWYTEILAPYLRERGRYYAALPVVPDDAAEDNYLVRLERQFLIRLNGLPELYDRVNVTHLGAPDAWQPVADGSVDLVLTFRNSHSFLRAGVEEQMFAAWFRALKPGGILGVVQHRAPPGTPLQRMKDSGYVSEAQVIALAEQAGFRLDARAEINANPRDTADHPEGVWTLPPSLRLGDQDREKYVSIGESDRMTLRFVKP